MTDCHDWNHKVWEPLSNEPCFANKNGQVYQINVGFRVVQTGNRIIAILPNYELAQICAMEINKKLGF